MQATTDGHGAVRWKLGGSGQYETHRHSREGILRQPLIVDYLHYGNATDCWDGLPSQRKSGLCTAAELLAEIATREQPNWFLAEIIHQCYGKKSATVNLEELDRRIRASRVHRTTFQQLGCRGFSFAIDRKMTGYDQQWESRFQLREDVDLRIAMMPAYWRQFGGKQSRQWLYYPTNVRRALETMRYYDSHYMRESVPALAIALGQRRREGWVVLAMQSDAAGSGAACVREHFRGWRKVLLTGIVTLAGAEGREVLLSRSDEVIRGIHPQGRTVAETPSNWRNIYDRTATECGMEPIQLSEPVNIQLYRASAPVMSTNFFRTATADREVPCIELP